MPTYEYLCDACGDRRDHFQSMTEKPLAKCPACGSRKYRRLIGAGAGILFKGSGFHQTDYRSSGYREAAAKESGAQSPAGESSGNSTGSSTGSNEGGSTKAAKPSKQPPAAPKGD